MHLKKQVSLIHVLANLEVNPWQVSRVTSDEIKDIGGMVYGDFVERRSIGDTDDYGRVQDDISKMRSGEFLGGLRVLDFFFPDSDSRHFFKSYGWKQSYPMIVANHPSGISAGLVAVSGCINRLGADQYIPERVEALIKKWK